MVIRMLLRTADSAQRTAIPIYPIIDTAVCRARGTDPIALVAACLRGGAELLQIRAKDDSSAALLALVERAVATTRGHDARLIVNDRADIARLANADGVHVGQTDLPVESVRSIVGSDKIVGLSTHDPAQVDAALATDASYIAVGPIFATGTKDTGYDARGLDLIRYAAGRGKPVVAIGGITLERAPEVIAAGASALAVITDILAGDDPESRVRAYRARLPRQPFNV
jgi:thiamine-phosphate pyrophosphorylase